MPIVRRIRKRNATITVEAYGEVLFMPGGDVFNWQNRFSQRIKSKTIKRAPSNKRPRWDHYGKPLKQTIMSAYPRFWSNGRDKMRVYGAVGSKAGYAAFVDQGTGVFNGGSPWQARILPPWPDRNYKFYEATWRPPILNDNGDVIALGKRVSPVMIQGQPGQHFFDKGLHDAFRSMRMRSVQLPGEGGPKITDALRSIPSVIEGTFLGPTATPAFMEQLNKWRRDRDEAWGEAKKEKRGRGVGKRARQQAERANRAKPSRAPKPPPPRGYASLAQKQAAAVQAFRAQNPNVRVVAQVPAGLNVISPVNGRMYTVHWDRLYRLLG